MKKLLIPILLSQLLLAECSLEEKMRANELWKQSRAMEFGMNKYNKLQKANGLCSNEKIIIDTTMFLIANDLSDENMKRELIEKIDNLISEVRSKNNSLLNSKIQIENAQMIKDFTDRLVEIRKNRNAGNLAYLEDYSKNVGDKKGFDEGEWVLVPIKFSNGKDRVQGNKNIDALVRKIKYTLSQNSKAEFTITGYASSVGDATKNEALSERRAINTKNYIENYIPRGKIKTFDMGESDLICNGGYAINIGANEYKCKGGSENEASSRRVEVLRRK